MKLLQTVRWFKVVENCIHFTLMSHFYSSDSTSMMKWTDWFPVQK